jgi:inorganic pyrophosphatase
MEKFNSVIEISSISGQVKYEQENGILHVDRFLVAPMFYPCNYGFISNTLGGDEDPLDVLVYSSHPILPCAVIKCRAVGALITEDEKGEDVKILALPDEKVDSALAHIKDINDVPQILIKQIEHFFTHYKDLEPNKWVKVKNWIGREEAFEVISKGYEKYNNQ